MLQGDSCGGWITARRSQSGMALQFQAWVIGFLTGRATAGADREDLLRGMDSPSAFVWIDNYCQSHPLDRLWQAADALVLELATRPRN